MIYLQINYSFLFVDFSIIYNAPIVVKFPKQICDLDVVHKIVRKTKKQVMKKINKNYCMDEDIFTK